MKKFFTTFTVIAASALMLVSCGTQPERANTPITDYLFGLEYDDYDFSAGVEALSKYKPAAAGCSEVRKGVFVGRNLDWYINHDASAVIKVNASENRYASLGVIGCATQFNDEFARSGEYGEIYRILPMFTVDGVNEKGLYAGVNVMPTGETSLNPEHWNTGAWGLGAAFTNPESDKSYCVTYLVRVILDNAASVAEAKELIKSINWFEPAGFPHDGQTQAFHWLISDTESSMVVEFLDNVPCFTETASVTDPSYATIMTNFTNKLMADQQLMQTSGIGYERWDILAEAYPDAEESFEGMQDLMKKVWYTQFYTADAMSPDFLMSEFASAKRPAQSLYHNTEFQQTEEWAGLAANLKKDYNNPDNWHNNDTNLWYTTHTSVYNIASQELHLILHEGFDEQKDFISFSLADSHFAKPLEMAE